VIGCACVYNQDVKILLLLRITEIMSTYDGILPYSSSMIGDHVGNFE
jgi:hypothetical protein